MCFSFDSLFSCLVLSPVFLIPFLLGSVQLCPGEHLSVFSTDEGPSREPLGQGKKVISTYE